MEGKRPKQIPLACRFLPYDQWFLTHVDPTWKIKHIKQIILAKCLSLSFDPRKLARETTGVRPPSPITFAPDESRRPVSPIQFATPQEVRRKKSQMHAAGGRGWLDEGDGSGVGGGASGGGAGGRGTGSGEGGFFGDDEDGLGLGLGTGLAMGVGMGIGLSGVGGEEGYEEDDEWDDEDDVPSGGLISPGKRSSIVMGGRVQVPGGTPNWPVVGSPPPPPAAAASGSSAAAAATPTSPMKIRKKFNPLAKIAASSFTVNANTSSATPTALSTSLPTDLVLSKLSNHPNHPTSTPSQHPPPIQSPTPQIYTALYTLIRFSTGQILEEDIPVSWYDLLPNELVELHASIPPLSFGMSKRMGWNLMYPREMMEAYREWDVKVVVERRVGMRGKDKGKDKAGEKEMGKKKIAANTMNTMNTTNGVGNGSVSTYSDQDPPALPYPISSSLTLVSLPRHDPYLYAQPYWEGWVRALRMVYCDPVHPVHPSSHNTSHPTTGSNTATATGTGSNTTTATGTGSNTTTATGTGTGANTTTATASGPNAHYMPMQEYAMGMTNFSGSLAGGLAGAGVAVGGSGSSGSGFSGVGVSASASVCVSITGTTAGSGSGSGSGSNAGGGTGPAAARTAGLAAGGQSAAPTGQAPAPAQGQAQGSTNPTHTTRHHTRMEWRERYVVIKDGVVNLFKSRDDLAPTHRLPLNNLLSLRDASHVLPIVNNRNMRSSDDDPTVNGGTGTGTGTGGPPSPAATVTPTHSHSHSSARMKPSNRGASVTPAEGVSRDRDRDGYRDKDRDRDGAQRKRRSTSLPRSGTSTLKDPKRGESGPGPRRTPAPPSSSSSKSNFNASPKSGSGSRTDVDERSRASSSYTHPHPHVYSHPRPLTGAEVEARRKEAEKKQKERERRERERRQQEQDLKEMEYLKQWDDLRFGWSKGKEKEKEKGKGKEKEKGKGKEGEKEKGKAKEKEKEREGDRGRMSERARVGETSSSKGKERERESDRDREREKDRDREREKHRRREKDRDRERQRQREKEKAQRDERTFIPASKEEAEAAGMKIVCAKFRHLRPWDKEYLDRELAVLDSRNQSLVNPAARMAAAAAAAAAAAGAAAATASLNTLGAPGGAVASSAVSALSGSSSALSGGSTPRYTSTGPSLAGSTVTVNVNANAASEAEDGPSPGFTFGLGLGRSGERMKHSRNMFSVSEGSSTNNSSNHPYQQSTSAISAISGPPRKSSFPTLVGLLGSSASTFASASASAAGVVGAASSNQSSLTLAPSSVLAATATTSSLALHSVTSGSSSTGAAGGGAMAAIASSASTSAAASPIVSGPPKFIGGLFGKDKDKDKAGDGSATTDKEERKREEKERKAREKEQKALEKEKKKAAKRKEREETGDEDDGVGTTSSGWKLRLIPSSSAGRVKEREVVQESMDTQATVTASLSSPQPIAAAPSSSTLLPGRYMEEDRAQAAVAPSYRSIKLAEDQQQDKPRSSISLPNLRDDPHPPIPPNRPKLTLSPVKDPSASTSASAPPTDLVSIPKDPETTNVIDDDAEVDPEQHSPGHHSDSGSSSRSLSSPVFAHSGDDGESGEDFDDEFGIGVSGYRRDRMGYRYGGFHQAQARKLEKEKEAGKAAGSAAAGGAVALASAEVTSAPPAPASALTLADQDVRGVQSRVAVSDVAEVGGAEKGRDGENRSGTGPERRDVSQTRSTQSQPQRRLRKREDERGEWIVLDMGNEQAYNSMLRVLHRCFAQPLTSTFVNPSIGDRQPASSCTAPPAQTRSPLNSPTQSTFWSTTTLVGGTGSDARSVVSERTKSLRTVDSFSSMYVPPPPPSSRQHEHEHGRSHGRPSTTSSDTDDESVHANPAQAPVASGPCPVENNQAQDPSSVLVGTSTQSRAEHPPILQTSSKPPKRGALAPALHYPEWRLEIVRRAKRHGLREAGRPLDLALNGLNAEMDERDIRARMKVWEERERSRRELEEQEAQRMDEMRMRELQERVGGEEDAEEGDDDDEEEEEESSEDESDDDDSGDDEQQPTGFDEEQRRMSAISHVSTLNAMQMNAAAAAALANRPLAATTDQTFVSDEDDDHDAHAPSAAHVEDELAAVSEDDVFKQRYSFQYGHEDEEDAIALGMESFMEDSDEESETEWLAWVTDLPRQVEVRARKRAEREKERKRLEQERQQRQLEVPVEGEGRDIQLSPMVFSDPFAHDQDHPSQLPSSHNGSETNLVVHVERSLSESRMSFNGSIRSGSSSVPISQAEERRQVVESRRMMEPTATSTFIRISTPPPPPSVLPVPHPTSAAASGVGLQNLLSQASTSSISAGPNVLPISINVSSATAGPRSPQLGSFSPESDATDGYRDAPSSSTTPPSAGVHYQAKLIRAKTHSRAPSGDASTRLSRLHHSTSMPFAAAPAAAPSALAVSGNSVLSTPPKSPMRSVSASISNSTPTGVNTSSPSRANPIQRAQHAVEMPILTQEQIQQIEAETDLMIKQNSTRMSSSPAPSSYTSHTHVSLPRRSSSAGTGASVPGGFASGSSPSRTMPGSSSESRMGGAGSMGRSASVLVKPHAAEVGSGGSERERRGVLRKRLSDLGKQISGDEKDGSPTSKSKKPKLSLAGLGGGGSSSHSQANNQPQSDIHSPTNPYQRQGLRSPTISNASSSAYTHGGPGGGVVGSGSGSSGTMASAKALLRRVRSGSSLRMDMHTEEHESPVASNYPVPNSPTSAAFSSSGGSNVMMTENASRGGSWGRETSPEQSRKRKGPVERLVQGLDSALEFRDGR